MRITRLETLFVKPRWLFLKMYTDEGLVGLGEPIVEGRARTVAAAVHEIERYLIGKDPRRIEHHWQAIYRGAFYRGGPVLTSALSGIEHAMWDITGKWLGVPIYQLLGGAVRDRIRVYRHFGGHAVKFYGKDAADEDSPDAYALAARRCVEQGFNALKTLLFDEVQIVDHPRLLQEVSARMAAIREAVGPDVDVGVDFHGRTSPAMAVQLARVLEPYHPFFIEEPVLPGDVNALSHVASSTTIPVATGERLSTKWDFREILEKQAASILQPDLSHAGGILECKKIAAMAESHYVAIAPHCPLGPISLAAALQVDACTPNFLCQEQVTTGEGYIKEPFTIKDGYVELPAKPGLGVELDEDALAGKLDDGTWTTPRLWHSDGSVADW